MTQNVLVVGVGNYQSLAWIFELEIVGPTQIALVVSYWSRGTLANSVEKGSNEIAGLLGEVCCQRFISLPFLTSVHHIGRRYANLFI